MRADVTETLCVQGAPGTGKTAVGLHRAAYLLYTHRDRLRRGGVLVVGPNSAFLSYISAVLPALGEVDVRQVTLEELVGAPGRGPSASTRRRSRSLKGDPRMATVLSRAVHAGLVPPTEPLVLPRGSHRWRVPDPRAARDGRRADAPATSATARPGRCSRSGWRTRCSPRWRRPASPPTTGPRTRWPAACPVRKAVDRAVAGGRPGAGRDVAAVRPGGAGPRRRRRPRPGRAGAAAVAQAGPRPEVRAVVAGRRGPRRRGRRPGRARAEPRPRRARRGAGPLPDAAARGRPPLLDRLGHRARRHRPGHHAVGHRRLGRVAARTSASRPRTSRCCAAATGCPRP